MATSGSTVVENSTIDYEIKSSNPTNHSWGQGENDGEKSTNIFYIKEQVAWTKSSLLPKL
jgi:hypothetical protein